MEININSNQFQNVLKKAIEVKPLVRPGAAAGSYLVRGSKLNGDGLGGYVFYPVAFRRGAGGRKIGECLCAGAMRGFHCYHLAAALMVHVAYVRQNMRPPAPTRTMSRLSYSGSESVRNLI